MHRSFLGRKRWTEDCRQSKGMEVRKDSLFKRSEKPYPEFAVEGREDDAVQKQDAIQDVADLRFHKGGWKQRKINVSIVWSLKR